MAAADGDYAQEHYHQNDFSEGAASEKDDESGNLLGGTWKTPPSRLGRAAMLIWLGVIITCIAGLVALVFTAVTVESISAQLPRDYGDCGASRTAREAREKGCVFDAMSWIWTRPECYDEELSKGYLKRANFTFHTDPNLTAESQVSMESVIRGDHPNLFTQNIYHSLHCTYMWKKMHKSLIERRPVDDYLTRWHHTDHCEAVLLNDLFHEDIQCTAEEVCEAQLRSIWTSCKMY